MKRYEFIFSPLWNIFLITAGSILFSLSMKGIAVVHQFISGGLFGSSLLIYYALNVLSPGWIYLFLNLPLFLFAWLTISKRFFYYSLYAMVVTTLAFEAIELDFGIQNQLYAAVACGVLSGAGAGIVLRSLGSNGGLDVIAVYLYQRFNIGVGKVYFGFNLFLFMITLLFLDVDLVIASLIMVFITAVTVDYTLSLFNQRKVVFIVSERTEAIARAIQSRLNQGGTYLKAKGVYSGMDKHVLMTVINNIQLKKLEEIVFTEDNQALFIVENTFSVLGASFSRRKVY
jgi:uncharacterized membrane-anchored protein YitT (DUF2179 family)